MVNNMLQASSEKLQTSHPQGILIAKIVHNSIQERGPLGWIRTLVYLDSIVSKLDSANG